MSSVCLSLGVLVLFLAFFAFLHCWLNAFAEMLRFADRMFYKVHRQMPFLGHITHLVNH